MEQNLKRYENALIENFTISENEKEKENENEKVSNNETNIDISNNELVNNINEAIISQSQNSDLLLNNINKELDNNSKNVLNNTVNTGENMISNKFIDSDDSIFDMMKKLEDVELMCGKLDKEQKIKDDLEQIRLNKIALHELNNQESKIGELEKIVEHLRREKQKRDIHSNKCRVNLQNKLDKDYDTVKQLTKKGFLKDESHKVNIKLPKDGLKFDLSNISENDNDNVNVSRHNSEIKKKKCNRGRDSISLNKLDNNVCYGCDSNTLKSNIKKIKADFRN